MTAGPADHDNEAAAERLTRVGRSALLGCSALAAALYGWGLGRGTTHFYYTAAIRSMTLSWHNFFFGAFDPAGSITTDKLPGWLWVHAAFASLFGLHDWVLLLPELLAATATVPLLFGAVRRWAGVRAGFITVAVFLLTPAVFVTAQVNIPDTLLVLCVVAAGYALVRALQAPGFGWLALSALLLGIAFQMKMLEALLCLPAFGLAYLVCAVRPARVRVLATAGYGILTLAVALSWVVVVGLVPADQRPRIDGSTTNSIWDMVFVYNGIGRGTQASGALAFGGPPGPLRLFNEKVGGEISWLLPLAVLLLVVGLAVARGRRDRAGWLLWGGWLVACAVAFSVIGTIHPYYTVLMAPALAAVVGAGLDRVWSAWRARQRLGWLVPIGVVVTVGWAVALLLRQPTGFGWLVPVVVAAGVLATALVAAYRMLPGQPAVAVVGAVTGLALILAPAAWMLSTPAMSLASAADPVAGPAAVHASMDGSAQLAANRPLLRYLQAHRGTERFLFAAGQATLAAPYIDAGQDVFPLRGFTDVSPATPGSVVAGMVANDQFRYVLILMVPDPARSLGSEQSWLRRQCAVVPPTAYGSAVRGAAQRWAPALYDCH